MQVLLQALPVVQILQHAALVLPADDVLNPISVTEWLCLRGALWIREIEGN
jgi:hypothetical protein